MKLSFLSPLIFCLLCLAGGRALAIDEVAGQVVFVTGSASMSGVPGGGVLTTGRKVRAGETVRTGVDGYVHIRMLDGGFLIVRPDSRATVVRYQIDAEQLAQSQVKLELVQGAARFISGEAVKKARESFRFNTPVAAIGVRGTDFTVVATADSTQVAVHSGGVTMSGFSAQCSPAGDGPCSDEAVELFAGKHAQFLFLARGQMRPQLLDKPVLTPHDSGARQDESAGQVRSGEGIDTSLAPLQKGGILMRLAAPAEPSTIAWGRWQAVLDNPASVDFPALQESHGIVAVGQWHVLLREKQMDGWQVPRQGAAGFALQSAEAFVFNERSLQTVPGSVTNGQLTIDFARARFSTALTLTAGQEQWALQTQGAMTPNGRLSGDFPISQTSNMGAHGAIDRQSAAYLFRSRLDEQRVVSGVTSWTKQP